MEVYKILLIVLAVVSMGVLIYASVQFELGERVIHKEIIEWAYNPYYMTLEGAKEVVDICAVRIEGFTRAGDFNASELYLKIQSIFSKRVYELTEDSGGLKFEPINYN